MISYKELLVKLLDELSHHEGVDVYFDVEDVIDRMGDYLSKEEKNELTSIYKLVRNR